jgi:glycosyltransferase involved in cell wall biosynthesis
MRGPRQGARNGYSVDRENTTRPSRPFRTNGNGGGRAEKRTEVTRRTLYVIPTLARGGAEKQLWLLASRLPREEFEVHVCALDRGGAYERPLREAGVDVAVIDRCWRVDPVAYWRLRNHIRRIRPDVVHTWCFAANSYGRLAALSAGVRSVVASERCVDRWKGWHELAIDRYLARHTRHIVANCRGVRDFYASRGLPPNKFIVIPNGIGLVERAADGSRESPLANLGLPDTARMVAVVGSLTGQKRIKDLIWAADLLKVIRDDVHLLVIGDGPQRWRLERFRDQVQIRDRVHFLGERDDVTRLLPYLDCMWLASAYEGMSNAVMEAMAAGLPVVATDIPGNRELVVPERTGYLVPVGDRAGFARWTNLLLNDRERAARMGEAGRQRVLAEFSIERMVERYVEMYRGLENAM